MKCPRCGTTYSRTIGGILTAEIGGDAEPCPECAAKEEKRRKELEAGIRRIILTTTNHVEHHQVVAYLGIESVEVVLGTGPFSEFTGGLADMFGARSTAFEKKLQQAKQAAMFMLQRRAAERDANAVIGVDLDYTEFSGNRIGLILSGTLVSIVPVDGLSFGAPEAKWEPSPLVREHRGNASEPWKAKPRKLMGEVKE